MASQITSGSQIVSLLSSAPSQAAGLKSRDAGTSGFSDVLRGQLRSSHAKTRPEATPAAERPTQKRPERPDAGEGARETKRSERTDDASAPDRADKAATTADDAKAVAEGTANSPKDKGAEATPADKATTAANEPANEASTDKADPATAIAGLPAEIAALMSAHAIRQTGETSVEVEVEVEVDVEVETDLAGKVALPGDTQGKPLQNPADPKLQAALNFTQATAEQGKAVLPLQFKPEAQSGFAERAATALNAVSADVPDSAQVSFMHALRHPGQITTTPQLTVATPAGQSAWADDVGNRVMWMVGRAESKAELVLTPPHLGKVEVSINLNGDQTTAQFVAATQSARDALEQAMPRLREILAQSGISLGQANVSTSGDQQASGDERGRGGNRGSGTGGVETGGGVSAAQWTRQAEGLVDTFV
ncbi:flagellar hook-length control protein FliK [Azoarcus sp. L1K30]|uniref:flagellar hook-length control protein FliK n=1 Tax=Azoarcus sp. L1K30 TaxID=2820277 RepID=UPI001B81E50C|nr:flagellar hook-length control protein FliK [Azoarcus sp. L1K30]MBR0565920.1 flagellar hook-length control protein FliK [Azoarcus sp. L1K30]